MAPSTQPMPRQIRNQIRNQLSRAMEGGLSATEGGLEGCAPRGGGGCELGDLRGGEEGEVASAGGVGWRGGEG
jgi:hypothetical protein